MVYLYYHIRAGEFILTSKKLLTAANSSNLLICLQCGLFNDTDRVLSIVKTSFLAEKAVRSVGKKLLLSSTEERYSRLAVQRTQAANGQSYTILYLLTGKHNEY